METCKQCGSTALFQIEGMLTCTECGAATEKQAFTWSYNHHSAPMNQRAVYNRTKRFTEYIRSLKRNAFLGKLNDILDIYNQIEFYFALHVKGVERKYFYSRKVVLFYIADRLGIDVVLPLLKDEERNKAQLQSILDLRGHQVGSRTF